MLLDDDRHRLRHLTLLQRIFMTLTLLVCISSDYFLLQHVYLLDYKLFRHAVDSAAHGSIAFCCWAIFLLQTQTYSDSAEVSKSILTKCILNGIIASLLDLDHFLAAGALSLTKATHLHGRPFGHTVSFIIVVAIFVSFFSRKCQARESRFRVCFIVVAWLSHQLRDGMRRGMWFWPFGSTPPITYILYLVMEEALPFVMAKWWSKAPALTEKETLKLALQEAEESDSISDDNDEAELLSLSSPKNLAEEMIRESHCDLVV